MGDLEGPIKALIGVVIAVVIGLALLAFARGGFTSGITDKINDAVDQIQVTETP